MSRLMLVDDEPEVVNLLSVILTMYGFDVSGFTDAARALQEARTLPPDLLLVDLIMPGMDGLSLVSAFDREPQLAGTPVLMLTGLATGEVALDGSRRGPGIGILEKPCEPEAIAAEVNRLLQEAASVPDYRRLVVNARRTIVGSELSLGRADSFDEVLPPHDHVA
jgi:two-component system OmpR family response regulator